MFPNPHRIHSNTYIFCGRLAQAGTGRNSMIVKAKTIETTNGEVVWPIQAKMKKELVVKPAPVTV